MPEQKYIKRFDQWNKEKKYLHNHPKSEEFYFNEGDVWWISFGVNVGVEIDGKNSRFERPGLVLKRVNRNSALVVPLTSTIREGDKRFVTYELEDGTPKSANISQVRTVDIRRFRRRSNFSIPVEKFREIKQRLKDYL